MFDPFIIFQRTQAGRDEIKQKSHGLTQSERLVLIMVDGVTSYQGMRSKLPSLTDERFERAIQKLQTKELILEVFMPVEGQVPEEIERTVIDRFLQQDPLDPVTIIMQDPEDELGEIGSVTATSTPPKAAIRAEPHTIPTPPKLETAMGEPEVPVLRQQAAMDEAHVKLADSLAQEVRAHQAQRAQMHERRGPTPSRREQNVLLAEPVEPALRRSRLSSIHWGYWLIGLGSVFIISFIATKLMS